jgi:4-amino-4-deoxy-L-arabinose transferase-like glycosyltransferase
VAGAVIGLAFLTKMMQGFLVLPAFTLTYLVAGPVSLWRRIGQVLAGTAALLLAAGWWVLVVTLWPASDRPYVGGSTNNTFLELVFGYNGLGRIFGGSGNAGAAGGTSGSSFGGATGLSRLFSSEMGTEISWLLPAALIGLVAGLWFTRRAPRTDRTRAALILWGGWLLVSGIVFSYMQGTIHPYYMVALAPAIAALVAISGRELWRGRDQFACRVVLSLMIAVTGIWDYVLLARTSDWLPALRWIVLVVAAAAALLMLLGGRLTGRLAVIVAGMALIGGLLGTSAYAIDTASQPHNGSIPTSGPSTGSMGGGFGGGRGGGGGMAGSGGSSSSSALVTALRSSTTRWAAATVGSQSAASLELSSGASVMAIGGFTGSDDSPTLAQFEAYAKAGQIHYFIAGGGMGGGPGGGGTASQITSWVESHYTATTIGGQTVYDLTK